MHCWNRSAVKSSASRATTKSTRTFWGEFNGHESSGRPTFLKTSQNLTTWASVSTFQSTVIRARRHFIAEQKLFLKIAHRESANKPQRFIAFWGFSTWHKSWCAYRLQFMTKTSFVGKRTFKWLVFLLPRDSPRCFPEVLNVKRSRAIPNNFRANKFNL